MILSTVGCARCGEPLEYEIGADDGTGELSAIRWCRECAYRECPPRWSHAEIKAAIRELNRRYGHFDEGTEIPLVIDTSPFPEEDW